MIVVLNFLFLQMDPFDPCDIDACFDSLLTLEEEFLDRGRKEGVEHGAKVGFEDGRLLGLQRGFDLGEEFGTMYGSTLFWIALQSKSPDLFSKRFVSFVFFFIGLDILLILIIFFLEPMLSLRNF